MGPAHSSTCHLLSIVSMSAHAAGNGVIEDAIASAAAVPQQPLRVRLLFGASLAPSLRPELKRYPEPRVLMLLPPPLVRISDLLEYVALTYLTKPEGSVGRKRKRPDQLNLLLDGCALLPSEVSE